MSVSKLSTESVNRAIAPRFPIPENNSLTRHWQAENREDFDLLIVIWRELIAKQRDIVIRGLLER
jgi:hypothetical protein